MSALRPKSGGGQRRFLAGARALSLVRRERQLEPVLSLGEVVAIDPELVRGSGDPDSISRADDAGIGHAPAQRRARVVELRCHPLDPRGPLRPEHPRLAPPGAAGEPPQVRAADARLLARGGTLPPPELADRLQHREARPAVWVIAAPDEALGDERLPQGEG